MNFLAGVLLTYLPSEADAYGALVVLMKERHLRELYKTDLAWLQVCVRPCVHHRFQCLGAVYDCCPLLATGCASHSHRNKVCIAPMSARWD